MTKQLLLVMTILYNIIGYIGSTNYNNIFTVFMRPILSMRYQVKLNIFWMKSRYTIFT